MKRYTVLLMLVCAALLSTAMPRKQETKSIEINNITPPDDKITLAEIHTGIKQIKEEPLFMMECESLIKVRSDSVVILTGMIKKQDVSLLTIANNVLFLPYNSVLINRIAIPAFDAITSSGAKEKYAVRRTILENQIKYANELYAFLESQNQTLAKIQTKLAWPAPADVIKEFHNLQVYKDYTQVPNWQTTYLGKFLVRVEKEIPRINSDRFNVFPSLIKELDALNFKPKEA